MLDYLRNKFSPKEVGVAIFKRDNGFFIHPEDKTGMGVWIAVEPCADSPLEVSIDKLGALIRENLLKSRTNIKYPKEYKGRFDFVLKKVKVRSYKQFMSGCRHCMIHQIGSKLILTHSVNNGTKGFLYTNEPSFEVDININDQELGEKAVECLEKSK